MTEETNTPSTAFDDQLIERVAERIHDRWAAGRRDEGWTFGSERDDNAKQHPCLVPYSDLPENEKEYDRATARETIAALTDLGYTISKTP